MWSKQETEPKKPVGDRIRPKQSRRQENPVNAAKEHLHRSTHLLIILFCWPGMDIRSTAQTVTNSHLPTARRVTLSSLSAIHSPQWWLEGPDIIASLSLPSTAPGSCLLTSRSPLRLPYQIFSATINTSGKYPTCFHKVAFLQTKCSCHDAQYVLRHLRVPHIRTTRISVYRYTPSALPPSLVSF